MKRHPLDILSLLLGVVFLLVAIAYLAGDLTGSIPSLQVAMPLMLVGLGVAGVAGAIAAQQGSDNAIAPVQYTPVEPATYAATAGTSADVSTWSAPQEGAHTTGTPAPDLAASSDLVAGDGDTAPADTVAIESPDRSVQDTIIFASQDPEHGEQQIRDE